MTARKGRNCQHQAVVEEVLEQFPDGVWLVELAPLADPALVPQTVANVLGIREEPGTPLLQTLVGALKPKSLLLILVLRRRDI